jgi:hypothetical protein
VPKPEAEAAWKEHVNVTAEDGLFKETKSWYFGDNIPGKAREVSMSHLEDDRC